MVIHQLLDMHIDYSLHIEYNVRNIYGLSQFVAEIVYVVEI
jgi:hypothetical protein